MTRILLACIVAALAAPTGGRAQLLPGVGLPASGLPGVGVPTATVPLPRMERPSIPRLPAKPPANLAPPPPPLGTLPTIETAPLDPASRDLGLSAGLAADANAALGLTDALDGTLAAAEETVGSYREQARELLRRHGRALEPDAEGRPVVRGEVMGVGISPEALARARKAGFRMRSHEVIDGLDLTAVVLAPPRGVPARKALEQLRALDPGGRYDLNHIYVESGGAAGAAAGAAPEASKGRGLRIGLIDGAVLKTHPVLRTTPVTQQAFAPGGPRVTAHATAVASLLAGAGPGFRGAAPGASLFVADVYGTTPVGGSAQAVARALGWLVRSRTPVIDISLVGPPNALLEAAVAAAVARGHVIVAAVGNDGPAAAPLYPAAYPGVVAVTAVDPARRPLPEAGRGPQVAFAAPGSGMLAAGLDGGLTPVRGTSFAAPLAAGRLAQLLPTADRAAAARAVASLGREAIDAGAPGRDPVFGRGLVALDAAVRPTSATALR